ncbi:hypothetical protein K439DRAFT_1379072 [Ramaria rubella]|nr:hypothetical protein K439DRAFT_1379072 [Ramaria rubella]
MGRWQSNYYDQVLGSKLKSLICGAIARTNLEKGDTQAAPTISYENFVQDLDHGDSFTTTLVDILVKELAERKTRPSSPDRHLIAERTANSLRNLTRSRIYHDRSSSSRRALGNDFFVSHTGSGATLDWDVLTQNADEDDIEIEDDSPRNEGIHRFNPSEPVYHPFAENNSTIRRSFPVQTADNTGTDDDTPLGYPTRRSPPAHFPVARHPSLSRQSSIRRPARSRTNDFNEFTSRRRPSGRHDQASQSGPASNPRSSVSGTGESSSSMDIANLLYNHHAGVNSDGDGATPVATFAPTSSTGALARRGMPHIRPSDERDPPSDSTSNSRLRPFSLHSSASSSAAPSSSRLHVNAPRLRRGGVRAPEQYGPTAGDGYTHTVRISSPPIPGLHTLSHREDGQRLPIPRRSSSAEMEYIIQTASARFGSRSPRSRSPLLVWGGNWTDPTGANGTSASSNNRPQTGTPTNLPTPRSISPEGSSTARE